MEKVVVSRIGSRRIARQALRYLHKSLKAKDLRALNAFVDQNGKIYVCAVLAPEAPVHIETFVRAVLGQGHIVEMGLDAFIQASLEAPETYIGIASKVFPAVKP